MRIFFSWVLRTTDDKSTFQGEFKPCILEISSREAVSSIRVNRIKSALLQCTIISILTIKQLRRPYKGQDNQ